jgi:hypothetical protein
VTKPVEICKGMLVVGPLGDGFVRMGVGRVIEVGE